MSTKKPNKPEERDFNPFKVRLNKEQEAPKQPGAIEKLRALFKKIGPILPTSSTSTPQSTQEEKKESKTAQQKYEELKLQGATSSSELQQNQNLDIGASEKDQREKIVNLIDTNINKKYFSEKKLDVFFEMCFELKKPSILLEAPRFKQFIEYDLKFVIQSVKYIDYFVGFTKFMVFFRIDQDPELYDILADQIMKNIQRFTTDELLTALVNFSHTLSTETATLFELACEEFCFRLDSNFNAQSRDLYIKNDDLPKIVNTMSDHKMMTHDLKEHISDYLKENVNNFNYNVLSELAVIYATKMDPTYKELFFKNMKEKFFRDLKFLDNDNFYKLIWSLVKSEQITVSDEGEEWKFVKEAVISKMKDLDPKTLTNILVLSTVGKDKERIDKENRADLYESLESQIILKMKEMQLPDLINLLWSVKEINKGTPFFFKKLEDEITVKLRQIKDEDFQILIECFTEQQSNFSEKFLKIILSIINEKKDKFELKTLVYIIWSFAKLDFNSNIVQEVLTSFKTYDRLSNNLGGLQQKSQTILLWTFSRNQNLIDREFLYKIITAIMSYEGQKFELDNFDILLLVQSCSHIERSPLKDDQVFMQRLDDLIRMLETFAIKNLQKTHLHEFTTISLFYLHHPGTLSKQLKDIIIDRISTNIKDFNELQLALFQQSFVEIGQQLLAKNEDIKSIEDVLDLIDEEAYGIQKEKSLIASEDKIREYIREQLREKYQSGYKSPAKIQQDQDDINAAIGGIQFDSRLEREMPKAKAEVKDQVVEETVSQNEKEIKKQNVEQSNQEEKSNIDEQDKLKKYLIGRKKK